MPFFQRQPDKVGTAVVADRLDNDRSRIGETIKQAAGIGRLVLLVANGTKEDFGITADIDVCTVPDAPLVPEKPQVLGIKDLRLCTF